MSCEFAELKANGSMTTSKARADWARHLIRGCPSCAETLRLSLADSSDQNSAPLMTDSAALARNGFRRWLELEKSIGAAESDRSLRAAERQLIRAYSLRFHALPEYQEAIELAAGLVDAYVPETDSETRLKNDCLARVAIQQANLSRLKCELHRGIEQLDRAEALRELGTGNPTTAIQLLRYRGDFHMDAENRAEAQACLEGAMALATEADLDWYITECELALLINEEQSEQLFASEAAKERALNRFLDGLRGLLETTVDEQIRAVLLINYAGALAEVNAPREVVLAAAKDAAQSARRYPSAYCNLLITQASTIHRDNPAAALADVEAAIGIARELNHPRNFVRALLVVPDILAAGVSWVSAANAALQAAEMTSQLGLGEMFANAVEAYSRALAIGRVDALNEVRLRSLLS